jgi:hypothetical protein
LGESVDIDKAATAPVPIDFLRNFYRRAYGMERDAAVKLMRALVDAGFIADDQRADAAIEKVALEACLNSEQLKAALKYAREQKWVAETIKRRGASSLKPGLTPLDAERIPKMKADGIGEKARLFREAKSADVLGAFLVHLFQATSDSTCGMLHHVGSLPNGQPEVLISGIDLTSR